MGEGAEAEGVTGGVSTVGMVPLWGRRSTVGTLQKLRMRMVVSMITLYACTDPTGSDAPMYTRVDPQWVTGEAATSVNTVTGLFELAEPLGRALARTRAESLGVAYVRMIAEPWNLQLSRAGPERDRGAPISWSSLRLCSRTTLSVGPLDNIDPVVPSRIRREYVSHWAVPLCGSDGVQLSVGVSDSPTSLTVVNSALTWTDFDSVVGMFSLTGVPERFPLGLPMTPEDAVRHVFEATGARVTSVPMPFNQHSSNYIGELPLCASWRLALDRPVSARRESDGTMAPTTEVYVRRYPLCFSPSTAFFVASAGAPSAFWFLFRPSQSELYDSVLVIPTGPIEFHRVSVQP